MDVRSKNKQFRPAVTALWIALGYVFLGWVYIVVYNNAVQPPGHNPDHWYNPFTHNTAAFVLASGLGLFIILHNYFKRSVRLRHERLEADVALRTALDRFPGPCALFDDQRRVKYLNQYFTALLGKKTSELLGQSAADLFPDTLIAGFSEQLEKAISTGEPTGGEVTVANGMSPRYFVVTFVPVRHVDKGIHRVISFAYDVSERKYSAMRADDQRRELRQIIDIIPNQIFVKDEEGQYVMVNKAFADLHGLSLENIIGFSAQDIWPGHPRIPLIDQQDREVLDQGKTVFAENNEIRDADGNRHIFNITKIPYRMTTDDRPALLGLGIDITDKVKVENERQVLSRLGVNLGGSRTADEVAQHIYSAVQELVPLDCFSFSVRVGRRSFYENSLLIDREITGDLKHFPSFRYEVPENDPILGVYEGETLLINRQPNEVSVLKRMACTERKSESLIFLPVCREDKVMAVMSVQSYIPGQYSQETLPLLRTVADMAGPAMESVRVARQKTLLGELGRMLSATSTAEEIAEVAANMADRLTGWDACIVGLYSPEDDNITYIYLADEIDGKRERIQELNPIRKPKLLAERVLKEGAFLVLREAKSVETGDSAQRMPLSMLWIPIPGNGAPVGFISMQCYLPNAYDDDDLQVISTLADYCASALNRTASQELMRYREERYRLAIESTGAVAYELDYIQYEYVFLGRNIEEMTGIPASEFTPATWKDIKLEMHAEQDLAGLSKSAIRRAAIQWQCQLLIRHRNGEERWISDQSVHLKNSSGATVGSLGILRDITEQKMAELALRASEERYALAAQGANDGLWDWDLHTDTIHFSERWYQMLGLSAMPEITEPERWFQLIHKDDLPGMQLLLNRHLHNEADHFECEVRTLHASGQYRWMLLRGVAVRDRTDMFTRIAGSQTDITDRVHQQERLQHEALHDSLTGLPNRALLMDEIDRRLAQIRRDPDYGFVLVFMDVDRFKIINDSLGHLAGDHVLVTVAERLQKVVRPLDVVSRFAGDEFALILDNISDQEISDVMKRIQVSIAEPMQVDQNEIITTASMGLVIGSNDYEKAIDLLRDADLALYKSKSDKPGHYQVFDRSMHEQALYRMRLEADLRKARERNQLRLAFLPVYNLKNGRLDRFEALLRWEHPELGMLMPEDFLVLAEETGLVQDLDEWVIQESCRWWNLAMDRVNNNGDAAEPVCVNINLSSQHFIHRHNIVPRIKSILENHGVNFNCFGFELKENVLTSSPERALAMLDELKSCGFKVFMDDFGVGASSIVNLHNTRFDAVKVDKQFMLSLQGETAQHDIVNAILAVAEKLGIEVVMEGVETERHFNIVRSLGCAYAQGFYIASPAWFNDALNYATAREWVCPVSNS